MPGPPFQNNPQSQNLPATHHVFAPLAGQLRLTATAAVLTAGARRATLSGSSVIIPERSTAEGILIKSTSWVWGEIVQALGDDWTLAYQLTPEKWDEIVAGAFKKAQYDEVTLTPRSGDRGRDVIAIKRGIGC